MKQELIDKVISGMSKEQKEDGDLALDILNANPEAFDVLLDNSNLKNSKDFANKAMHSGIETAYRVYDKLGKEVTTDKDFIISTLAALNEEKENIKAEIENSAPLIDTSAPQMSAQVPKVEETPQVETVANSFSLPGIEEMTEGVVTEEPTFNFSGISEPKNNEAPVFDENGFDISNKAVDLTENKFDENENVLSNLNEMYNNPQNVNADQLILK